MHKRARKHPVLGWLRWDDRLDSWEAEVELAPGSSIRFAIEPDRADQDPDQLFEIGADYLNWARGAERQIRERVADDLLGVYNASWADDDPEEGTPPMQRAEFLAHIRPSGISLYHDGSAAWYYSCGDLFAGHGIWLMFESDRRIIGRASLSG